jgi:hypothetical protein
MWGRAVEPGQSHRLTPGTPVWVWVVRLGKGRWWPGAVERLRTIDGRPRVAVKFECRRVLDRDGTPVIVGITTTAMRYLELRNINSKGFDQPRRTPVSLLERPEELETPGPHVTDSGTDGSANDSDGETGCGLTSGENDTFSRD